MLCEISNCFVLSFDISRLFSKTNCSANFYGIMKKFYKDSCFLTLCVPYDTCGLNCYFSSFRKSFLFFLNEGLQIILKVLTMDTPPPQKKPSTRNTGTEQLSVRFLKKILTPAISDKSKRMNIVNFSY